MHRAILRLNKGREKSIERRHPWIFSGAVSRVDGNATVGDIVDVATADGRWVAMGHYEGGSIICKVLSFEQREADEAFWRERLESALLYRRNMGLFADIAAEGKRRLDVFRLIHGEGDQLPGLIVDYYNGIVVLQAHSCGMHNELQHIATLLSDLLPRYGLPVSGVYNKSAATLPKGVPCEDGVLGGEVPQEVVVTEYGSRMFVDVREGQKTGFFVDQRANRHLLSLLSQGRRVLNCFGYTGGFSVAALNGGASQVATVDISQRAIEACNRNVELNFGGGAPHRSIVADVPRWLDEVDEQYDIIILDPPAFAKNHKVLQQGLKGYRYINMQALRKLPKGGLLLTFSCSQAVSADDFQTACFSAAVFAGRKVRVVQRLTHAADHPVSIYHPEGEYLKGLLLQVE
ncbi:MAG: class I SAM-dependent rRNA methyltransferase [Bacteroidales bacterium]|nr:class I SAM-dependent rRNA methyltransferase [Bacteroidales bacterium]